MKKVILAGFGQPLLDLYESLKNQFLILGVILDYERKEKYPLFHEILSNESITVYSFEEAQSLNLDAVIVINYNKIIDVSRNKIPFILNIHMGLLPVYRGNSANSWSILNGDRKVGYSLHEVSDILDGGDVYYTFSYEIKENETYYEAKNAINRDIKHQLPIIIQSVINREIKGVSQENESFIYASKLYPTDGILSHWDYTTEEIINRNIIFSKPLGTGLKIKYKDFLIEICKMSTISKYKTSNGFPGAIVLKNPNGSVWVKTKDTAVSIDEIFHEGQLILPSTLFKIGERL
jgi:methionyl-tRNA formyltransferase